ncbi:MAG: LPD1 domain-containing protein [Candidatus Pristimantibacillus sp.]
MEQLSLFDYFATSNLELVDPAEVVITVDLNSPSTAEGDPGRKNYSYDCGEELLGARKHLSAMIKFSSEWQQAIEEDPSQAFKLVCKDELLDGFKAEQLQEEGFTSQVAYAIKLLWERVCQRPADDPKKREDYIQAVGELRKRLATAKTEDLYIQVIDQLRKEYKNARYSMYPLSLKKNPELLTYRYWLSLGKRYKTMFVVSSARTLSGYRDIYKKAFESEEGRDWIWAQRGSKGRNTAPKETVERWERKVPAEVIRQSQEPSGVSKPEDLIEQYGFRGIQFGNWVQDVAGKYHVLCGGNALADLTAILNIPKKAASLYGTLGLAFGARGTGAALAHYEPSSNIINLTKLRGGGALCHEWAHALDFNLFSYSHNHTNGRRVALSGNEPGKYLPFSISQSFKVLMKKIKEGNGVIRVAVPYPLPPEDGSYRSIINSYLERNHYDVNAALIDLKDANYRIKPKQWKDIGIMYCNILLREGRSVPTEFFIPTDESSFYIDAKQRGNYWKKDHELFARAFEAWIEDELTDRGLNNSYLVTGTRYGGPYPTGDERETINGGFREWWNKLNSSGILHDNQLWS